MHLQCSYLYIAAELIPLLTAYDGYCAGAIAAGTTVGVVETIAI